MKFKGLIIGVAAGVAASLLTKSIVARNHLFSSEEVLQNMKNMLKDNGKIIGSWIMTKPETLEKNASAYQVYRGGITREDENRQTDYEFVIDAKSGSILELSEV
ncbi:PepSY domain-containing protein [Caldibacillus lycopersici]|uniref:PepSY domain-containing protein n=1 Tax=Perspicuibacillus lycopersici TaxID=1325689 RepID=A0AAE3LNU9_9BACI|nr:PepSY domain-containing protein [Perspicuibacillus lycopersici]MCU9614247.1 PepSY domain-containing protein [Perspicuibacillus lycopersici]